MMNSLGCYSYRLIGHFRRSTFSVTLKAKVGYTLTKDTVLCVNLNVDGVSITSRIHTHPSHSSITLVNISFVNC
jgi:hypothetical protein